MIKFKSFREQLIVCINTGNCIEIECNRCNQKILLCKSYNCVCKSSVCRNDRIKKGINNA